MKVTLLIMLIIHICRVAGERGCEMIKNDHKHKILINDL